MTKSISEQANCMTVVIGKNASKTGSVLVAHNEDDYIHAKVRHHYVPARIWEEGTLLPAEEGLTRIPQIRRTFAYAWAEIIGENGGLATSDCFLNENGVCVVSDSSCGSRVDAEDPACCADGIVYELRRAVAERAKSASHALEVACELIDRYGYASAGRIYFFADRDEAYMMQIVRGKNYAACRIPDDAIAVMPNHYTIHSLKDCVRYSDTLVSHALEKGWYKPETEDHSDFDFAKVYQDPKTWLHPENTLRQKYATQLLLGREWDMEKDGFPPFVKANKPVGIRELIDVMATHYEGSKVDIRFSPGATPHETSVRRVCTATTVEAVICDFAGDAKKTTVWTTLGRPCGLMFIPLHPLFGEVSALETYADPFEAAKTHFSKKPRATCHESGIWQKMQDFQNLLEFKYAERIDEVRSMNKTLFESLYANEIKLRNDPSGDFAAADATALSTAAEAMEEYLSKEPKLVDACITDVHIDQIDGAARATVAFRLDRTPDAFSLLFGPGRTQISQSFALPVAGGLVKTGVDTWQAQFLFERQPLKADGEGTYEFILGGKDTSGRCFCGMTLVCLDEKGCGSLRADN